MNQSKIIRILIFGFVILAGLGGFIFFKQGWLDRSIAGLVNSVQIDIGDNQSVSLGKLIWQAAGFNGEKQYLLLFQNNLEIRPSGGYIGNFGILKVKNGKATSFETHDTNAFDNTSQAVTEPPQPFIKYIKVTNWQMRDANWSPDFETSAKQAEYFYRLQGGQKEFDGVIGINAAILPHLLELTGPIYLEKYDKTFTDQDVLYELEYEVEQGYLKKDLPVSQRKAAFKELIVAVLDKLTKNNIWQLNNLKDLLIQELEQKNLILFFYDQELQEEINKLGWSAQVNKDFAGDYLMIVEANLGARKSNYFVQRSIDYFLDFDGEKPQARLRITFQHKGQQNDWFSHDYQSYLRIYVPEGSWLTDTSGFDSQTEFSKDLGKTVFGQWIRVPTGTEKTIEFTYTLPASIKKESDYKILIQKQSGIDQIPIKIQVKNEGRVFGKEKVITKDWQGAILLKQ